MNTIKQKFFFIVLFIMINTNTANSITLSSFINSIDSQASLLKQGSVFAVLKDGKVVHKKTFGYKKVGTKSLIKSDDLFPVASISKAITGLAIMKLLNDGKLNLSEEFQLPYLEEKTTLTTLLTHSTGYDFTGNIEIEENISRNNLLQKISTIKPVCTNCYFYSNALFSLIDDTLKEKNLSLDIAINNLSDALKTNQIQLVPLKYNESKIVYRHTKNSKSKKITPLLYSNYHTTVPAAAGLYCSLNSMIEVLRLISGYRSDIISKENLNQIFLTKVETKNDMMSRFILKDYKDVKMYYGLGWRIVKRNDKPILIFHSGKLAGMWSFIGFMPAKKIGIVFFNNSDQNKKVIKDIINFALHKQA